MLVLKIETWKEEETHESGFPKTLYIEGSSITHRRYQRIDEDKEGQESPFDFAERIFEDTGIGEYDSHNFNEEACGAMTFSYFDDKGIYKAIGIFNPALVYLMQNGKTVDKFIV